MTTRNKSAIFLGLVAVAAIITGVFVRRQANTPQSDEMVSPALTISKQRAKAAAQTPGKQTVKTPAPGGK